MATSAEPPPIMSANWWKVRGPAMAISVPGRTVIVAIVSFGAMGRRKREMYFGAPPAWRCMWCLACLRLLPPGVIVFFSNYSGR